MTCVVCGTKNNNNAKFCKNCGEKLEKNSGNLIKPSYPFWVYIFYRHKQKRCGLEEKNKNYSPTIFELILFAILFSMLSHDHTLSFPEITKVLTEIIPSLFIAIVFFYLLARIYYFNIEYVIGNDKIIFRKGIFNKKQEFLFYKNIKELEIIKKPIQRFYDIADIKIRSDVFAVNLELKNIKEFNKVKNLVDDKVKGENHNE